ncbi:ABC transporter substrate-binding protein [Salinibacterium sp. ZJ454]|uniref:ABC transporter substrate-binding protein n=1 Tax=Salinibacterium sp. ZJ454 TaxID=2708339 RepID=UPI00142420F7|nr:ABC transporter substrate-binding protein [Salinibacterium sp. ZJ454]
MNVNTIKNRLSGSRRTTKRIAIAAVILTSLGMTAGCASGSSADTTDNSAADRTFVYGAQGSAFPAALAEELGFLADRNITIEYVNTSTPSAAFAALDQGDLDGVLGSPQLMMLHNKDNPDKPALLLESINNGDLTLVVSNDSGIPNAADGFEEMVSALKGKTIGVTAIGGALDFAFREVIRAGGLDPEVDVTIVTVQYGLPAMNALKTGQIDGYMFTMDFVSAAVSEGIGTVAFTTTDVAPLPESVSWFSEFLNGAIIVAESAYQEDPSLFDDLRDALQEAKEFAADPANADEVAAIAAAYYNISPEAAKYYVEFGLRTATPLLNCSVVETNLERLIEKELLPGPVPACSEAFAEGS